MRFTDKKVLSLPPYISTLWSNVISLQLEYRSSGHVLVIELKTGGRVEIPNLEAKAIEDLFATHVEVMRYEENTKNVGQPFPFGIFEGISSALQHNPQQAQMPPLPQEMLEKIAEMFKGVVSEDLVPMGKPELNCNCMYCQIMRAAVGEESVDTNSVHFDEEVTEKDLQFREWNVEQQDDKLFVVSSLVDIKEKYTVFLGNPIGCTCGNNSCEHIEAALRS